MKNILCTLVLICCAIQLNAQSIENNYAADFEFAYETYPAIPKGLLEGVAFAQTRIRHITGNNQSCTGIPQVKGVMGLTADGQGYFNNNLSYISNVSGIPVTEIITNPRQNILAYAAAYNALIEANEIETTEWGQHDQALKTLSEIPWGENAASDYALSAFTYQVFTFMNTFDYQVTFAFPDWGIDLSSVYGEENLNVLSSPRITLSDTSVYTNENLRFRSRDRSVEYGPALWNAAPSCNYSSRGGVAISAVTVHTIQGSYAGAISWSLNCASNVSYHYVARSSDGQITQMVWEADKAWHVGSENPYTIGIEHEGYVDDPAWYTEAMYVGSANLVRNITESGYGIDPLRTYKGIATAGTLTLGGCTKIKGHQHFPGASHTDPGINWDWEHYYQLINDDPSITTYTSATGTLFDSGGAALNYENDERFLYLIQPIGALTVTLDVVSFRLEEDWDYLYIYDGDNIEAPLIDVYTGTDIPDVITSTGGSILIEFRSDCATTDDGWEIAWSAEEMDGFGDEIAPLTTVLFTDDWYTTDFTSYFEDEDEDEFAGSGLRNRFYQVIDYDGVEWRANASNGFFSDNFDEEIHPDWNPIVGSWAISGDVLRQSDEAVYNSNIYASLNQNDENAYLYHWSGKIGGVGSDKRAGFHFMCDDATLTNRGNSYFVWFREDDNKVQLYKVIDDVFTLEAEVDKVIDPDHWYDFKLVFNKLSGRIDVWINNIDIISWTDLTPHTTGDFVSFRSGSSIYDINNFKVYKERGEEELVTIGLLGDARYQNSNPLSPGAKIKSIVIDSALNVSSINARFAKIDWTVPDPIAYINDGAGADIETTTTNTELEANWASSFDENSDIARYWYAIGSSSGANDIVDWTDNWYADTVLHAGLSLVFGETYYFSVFAENGAGLHSDTISSNGQLLIAPTEPPVAYFTPSGSSICGSDSILFENSSADAVTYEWSAPGAIPSFTSVANPYFNFPVAGDYTITLTATGPGGVDVYEQVVAIELFDAPIASFAASAYTVLLEEPLVLFENESENADGYYWRFGDGSVSTDINPYHAYEELGDFIVELIAINGNCPNDTTEAVISVVEDNGAEDFDEKSIEVFPSPVSEVVYLQLKDFDFVKTNIKVYDAQGRCVYRKENVSGTQLMVDVSSLEKGTYFVLLSIDNKKYTKKFVKI